MNIMLTSAGRRGYMVNYFKEALHGIGKVYVGNCDENVVSFLYADEAVKTPLIYDVSYINFLIEYCLKNDIKVIVPLFDIDLLVLSLHKSFFEREGIHVIVSDSSVIQICNDKYRMSCYLNENKLLNPKTYISLKAVEKAVRNNEVSFPLIVKPRYGMGSIGVEEVNDIQELRFMYLRVERKIENTYLKYESMQALGKNIIIQEKIEGQEFGVDIINDLTGNYQNSIIKKKYSMRAGETDSAIVVKNEVIEHMSHDLGRRMGHIGNLDTDIILSKNNRPYILDLNARFGGGYPFSHCAGVNLPKAILMWLSGKQVDKEMLTPKIGVKVYKDIGILSNMG